MTSSNRNDNDLTVAQEKLKWVTPKISLMEAENTEGGKIFPVPTEPPQTFNWSFLTNFTSNLATPTKLVSGKGLKGPFFSKLRSFEALITWHGYYCF